MFSHSIFHLVHPQTHVSFLPKFDRFFDECESIFESRDRGNRLVNMLLSEIERHDGIVILATNRAFDLDEAMHRRITLAAEFKKPDHLLRSVIWRKHLPEALPVATDVDISVSTPNLPLFLKKIYIIIDNPIHFLSFYFSLGLFDYWLVPCHAI